MDIKICIWVLISTILLVDIPKANGQSLQRPTSCPSCQCGIHFDQRIVGGIKAAKNEFPAIVMMKYTWSRQFFCSGTLINDLYAASAAHCVMYLEPSNIYVLLKQQNVNGPENQEYRRNIVEIIRHSRFRIRTFDSDITLLKFDKRVDFNALRIAPACLPTEEMDISGLTGTVAGWGATYEGGSNANELRKVDIKIFSNMECSGTYTYRYINRNMICAGAIAGGKDACQGDSGGPLFITQENNKKYLTGIVSFGLGCAQPNAPGVYTKVQNFLTWIKDNTPDACWCP